MDDLKRQILEDCRVAPEVVLARPETKVRIRNAARRIANTSKFGVEGGRCKGSLSRQQIGTILKSAGLI